MRVLTTILICLSSVLTVSAQDFQDVSLSAGIQHTFMENGTFGGGASFMDFDGDGRDDITLASHLGDDLYFYRNTGGAFERVYFDGLTTTCQSKQVLWVDYDNDGDKDFFAACHPQRNHLFENTGAMVFEDVTLDVGLDSIGEYTFGATFGDYDKDGDLDLLILNRALDNRSILMYENNGDGTFTDITEDAGVADIPPGPFLASFIDHNNDSWPDIYVAQDKYYGNNLLSNNGDGTFTDRSMISGLGDSLDAMSVAPGDYDNDGDIDLYVTNTPLEGNHLFRNDGDGTYTEVIQGTDLAINGFDWGANFFDVENDGDLDLYVSGIYTIGTTVNSWLFHNDGFGNLDFASPGMPNDTYQSYSNAVGDFDDDGFPDIVVNNFDGTPSKLWQNRNGIEKTGGNWIKIRLEGTTSNRDGIGSLIEVFAGGKRQIRYTYTGEGFIAQNAGHEIFGLGNSITVDSIQVTWLSGIVDVLYDEPVNQDLTVVEGASLVTGLQEWTDAVADFHVTPDGTVRFTWKGENGPVEVRVYQADGKLVRIEGLDVMRGTVSELRLDGIARGLYFLELSTYENSYSKPVTLY